MVLHYIIKKIIYDYGRIIVSDLRLYNILADLNAFKYEPESIKFILKQVLQLRGKEMLDSCKRSLPVETTLNQYIQYISEQCGFVEKQVRYVVESLAYGIGWISQLSKSPFYPESFERKLEITAYIYNIMCINITQIEGSESLNRKIHNEAYEYYDPGTTYMGVDILKFDSFKNPIDKNWKDYIFTPQDKDFIANLEWKNKTGIGIICGFNNIRAIDIDSLGCFDNCDYGFWSNPRSKSDNKFDSFIEYCLYLLNLPKDYKWVVRSGSGRGIHIIFKCEDIEGIDIDVTAFTPNKKLKNQEFNLDEWHYEYKKNVDLDFHRLELFWKGHIVAYPSRGVDYDGFNINSPYEPNHNQYDYVNTNNSVPLDEPSYITIKDLDNLLVKLCGEARAEWHEYNETKKRYSKFFRVKKLRTSRDSMGGYNVFRDSLSWLEQCTNTEGINSLGVYYVLDKNYEEAARCFRKANSDLAHYNLAEMILFGYIKGNKNEILEHYDKCKNSNRIHSCELDDMKRFIDEYK